MKISLKTSDLWKTENVRMPKRTNEQASEPNKKKKNEYKSSSWTKEENKYREHILCGQECAGSMKMVTRQRQ